MLIITRRLAHQLRTVMRRAFGSRGPGPAVCFTVAAGTLKAAYAACRDAVTAELARQQTNTTGPANGQVTSNGNPPPHSDALLAEFWDG